MPGDGYNPIITLKKFAYGWLTAFIGIILPFTISYVQDFDWPQELLFYVPIIIAVLVALENTWKHWNDSAT
jgi:hypothetical protein